MSFKSFETVFDADDTRRKNDAANNRAQYKEVWFIRCKPDLSDDTLRFRPHIVGYFTSAAVALAVLGGNMSSYDDEDRCKWTYTIRSKPNADVSDRNMAELDDDHDYLPYT